MSQLLSFVREKFSPFWSMLSNQGIDTHVTEFYAIFAKRMRNNFCRPAKVQMLFDETQKLDVSPFSVLVRRFSSFYRSVVSYVR